MSSSVCRTLPNILFLSHSAPLPTSRGGNQRTYHLIQALRNVGHVDFVYIHRDLAPPDPELTHRLREEFGLIQTLRPWGGPNGTPRRLTWKVRALARIWAPRLGLPGVVYQEEPHISRSVRAVLETGAYDVVVCRYLETVAVSRPFSNVPVIADADDFEPTRFAARARAPGFGLVARWMARRSERVMTRQTPSLVRRCSHVWVTSVGDRSQIRYVPATVLPNIPFDPPTDPPEPAPDSGVILLVASFKYEVNRQAVSHFLRVIWPRIRSDVPSAALRIVGAGMPERLRETWSGVAGVDAAGFVSDLQTEYARCLFTVAPMFHGGGTKIKVLESLAFRRACVATDHVHAGFADRLPAGAALAVGATPGEFADRCVALLRDPEAARAMADEGRSIVRSDFSFKRFARIVKQTVSGEVMS